MLTRLLTPLLLAFSAKSVQAFGELATSPGAPIPGYGIVTPRWEIPAPDGSGRILSLRGTVEQVAARLRDIDPNYDVDEEVGKLRALRLEKRAVFDDDGPSTLCNNFREGNRTAIHVGIDYLRTVPGKPKNGAGPANCGRVSCRDSTGIWWCNDAGNSKELESFGDIADGAQRVLEKCPDKLDANQGAGMTVSGQAFHKDKWNVVVRGGDNCDDPGIDIFAGGVSSLTKKTWVG
ncbi:hypothetical protein CCHL11_07145 [Colletotrichum chlorophyti]|uniref:Ecp2 effector protein domain-containing protein n=1 Tax=Colletotrichum chlorophyti TaxID=708187 RepID=A0A1Q8S0N3_9PEZI|nr:hypothetical protein CCHL11_07145 [Colletotrichum chlorophyti]